MSCDRPRYTQQEFPPYSYVPGYAPHPVSDSAGHMYHTEHSPADPLQPAHWQDSPEYLFGIDLFNHGFYWEAHEAWESLWHAAGRSGPLADFLKGLIKLAATGVKAREGNPRGVQRHAARAVELLSATKPESLCGLALSPTVESARKLRDQSATYQQADPNLQLDCVLELAES